MPRKQRIKFEVSFTLPHGCSPGRAQEYVMDAVSSWARYLDHKDPIYELYWKTVKVVKKRKEIPIISGRVVNMTHNRNMNI